CFIGSLSAVYRQVISNERRRGRMMERSVDRKRDALWTGFQRVLLYLLLTLGALTMLLPFWWMFITAVKPEPEIFKFPPTFWPSEWHWENFGRAMSAAPFDVYFLNTVIFAVTITLCQLLLCSMAAYAFARL